jgi:broad specificity phosphatase PhoE
MKAGGRKIWSDVRVPANTCRLLLVRHATAEGQGRFQGQRDVLLSAVGRQELPLLCKKCAHYPVRAVYSSDLRRARETANAVARGFGLEVEVRPGLREMHFGQWEGLSWTQIVKRFPRLASLWLEQFPYQAIPGAEPLRQFRKRITVAIHEVVAAHRGQCALVVTHAGVIRFTLGRVLGLPARNLFRLAQDSCALNVIDYLEGGAVVRCING